jgi:hypothetical protein
MLAIAHDRRQTGDRRGNQRRQVVTVVVTERRTGDDRRAADDRRSAETAAEHIRNALQLVTHVAAAAGLDDEYRRDLDAALFRLRFALDRLEEDVE